MEKRWTSGLAGKVEDMWDEPGRTRVPESKTMFKHDGNTSKDRGADFSELSVAKPGKI